MSEDFWNMVEVYRKHEIPKSAYRSFKAEIRRTSLTMIRLSLDGVIYDSQLYPDTRELSDPVMDIRILDESGLPKVRETLDSTEYLRYEVKRMKFEDE